MEKYMLVKSQFKNKTRMKGVLWYYSHFR